MARDIEEFLKTTESKAESLSAPYYEQMRRDLAQVHEIIKLLVQSLILLHGGALVAIPAFASIPSTRPTGLEITPLLGIFDSGIACALAAAFVEIHALEQSASHYRERGTQTTHQAWARQAILTHASMEVKGEKGIEQYDHAREVSEEMALEFENRANKHKVRHRIARITTFSLLILSAVLLGTGAWIAAFGIIR